MLKGEDIVKSHKDRINLIFRLILLSFILIIARLWYLQIYKGEAFFRFSLKNILRQEAVSAPRGEIISRNGSVMAHNMPRFDAVIVPQYLKKKDKTLNRLSNILNMPVKNIKKILKKNSNQPKYLNVVIKKNIGREEVALIETENMMLPGVAVELFISREYPDAEVGAHMLGYTSEISESQLPRYLEKGDQYQLGDFVGQFGIEKSFDTYLRGKNGFQYMQVDARGRKKKFFDKEFMFEEVQNSEPTPGYNLKLTIDQDLQISSYKALEGNSGAVVVVEVNTGEILSMVSTPSFNPTSFSRGISHQYWGSLINNPFRPLRDRTIQEHYAPGSTFKVFAAIAALEEGFIDEKTEFNCTGKLKVGRRYFHCWKKYGHGKVDVVKSIRESCDIFYYRIAQKIDIDVLAKYAKMFGLGSKTNLNLDREVPGLIPTKEWKLRKYKQEWVLGETVSCIIGQSFMLTTPLQLALSYAYLASGGIVYKPQIVKSIYDHKGKIIKSYESEILKKLTISPRTLRIINKGLSEVMNHPKGTGWWRRGIGNAIAGKTGTSQVVRFSSEKIFGKCSTLPYGQKHHGLFVGYAPHDNPQISVAVVTEHSCGSKVSVPIAVKVVSAYLEKYFPELKEKNSIADKIMYKSLAQKRLEQKKMEETQKLNEDNIASNVEEEE